MSTSSGLVSGGFIIIIRCPSCGQKTNHGKTNAVTLRDWMLNNLKCPHCNARIEARNIACPLRETSVYVKRTLRLLADEGLAPIAGLVFRQ